MRKTLALLLVVGWVLGCCRARESGGFALHLLLDNRPASALEGADLADLPLRDQPLLAGEDIVWYDREAHEMELTPAAYARVQQVFSLPVGVDGLPFVVCVGGERIYAGAFWTLASSLSYDGVVITDPVVPDRSTIQISLGYPTPGFFRGTDPRSDRRVLEALDAAGKLR